MRRALTTVLAVGLALGLAGCGAESHDYAPEASSLLIETPAGVGVATWLPAEDPEGDRLTYELLSAPAHGTLTLYAGTGEIVYIPDAGFAGSDWFAWRAHDGSQWSEVAYVTVHVVEPVIVIVAG